MHKPVRFLVAVVALLSSVAGRGAPSTEPRNLDLLKDEIRAYVDSGRYLTDITSVAQEATAWLEQRAKSAEAARPARLAMVFDLDETTLSGLPYMRAMDFGDTAEAWAAFVARGDAPAIEPVREVYRTARRLGVAVIFLTVRKEQERPGTEKNLRAVGAGEYERLIFQADDSKDTAAHFKMGVRARLAAEGYVIIANIGDQESDLAGGYAERTFKLPDPFYLIK